MPPYTLPPPVLSAPQGVPFLCTSWGFRRWRMLEAAEIGRIQQASAAEVDVWGHASAAELPPYGVTVLATASRLEHAQYEATARRGLVPVPTR
jgi:hypothetical protein